MDSLKEQRIAVKFCVKLGKSATETFSKTSGLLRRMQKARTVEK